MTYCAPCLADLALVREAATSVSGTAACVAHAVLLTHPHDTPQRRLERLSDLRSIAEGKLPTASTEDVPTIELLVQEYALAGAMDMTVPLKDLAGDRTPRPPKSRRNRGGRDRDGRERGPRPEGTASEAGSSEGGSADVSEAQAAPAHSASDSSGESAPPVEAPAPVPTEAPAPGSSDLSEAQGAQARSASDSSGESAPVAE
jgi:hypothetical protein